MQISGILSFRAPSPRQRTAPHRWPSSPSPTPGPAPPAATHPDDEQHPGHADRRIGAPNCLADLRTIRTQIDSYEAPSRVIRAVGRNMIGRSLDYLLRCSSLPSICRHFGCVPVVVAIYICRERYDIAVWKLAARASSKGMMNHAVPIRSCKRSRFAFQPVAAARAVTRRFLGGLTTGVTSWQGLGDCCEHGEG